MESTKIDFTLIGEKSADALPELNVGAWGESAPKKAPKAAKKAGKKHG
jgi:hypothetical protein